MNRDSKLIFEGYKLVKEQDQSKDPSWVMARLDRLIHDNGKAVGLGDADIEKLIQFIYSKNIMDAYKAFTPTVKTPVDSSKEYDMDTINNQPGAVSGPDTFSVNPDGTRTFNK